MILPLQEAPRVRRSGRQRPIQGGRARPAVTSTTLTKVVSCAVTIRDKPRQIARPCRGRASAVRAYGAFVRGSSSRGLVSAASWTCEPSGSPRWIGAGCLRMRPVPLTRSCSSATSTSWPRTGSFGPRSRAHIGVPCGNKVIVVVIVNANAELPSIILPPDKAPPLSRLSRSCLAWERMLERRAGGPRTRGRSGRASRR